MNDRFFKVSVVIPAYNEEGNIEALTDKLIKILSDYQGYEIIFVDDGSEDKTLEILKALGKKNHRVRYVSLSRNFGHQNALKAGLDRAEGDCVITMDADLQHPPELIPIMIQKWQEGYEVVYTIRERDPHISIMKRMTSNLFYRLINRLSDFHIPKGAADFRLLDRSVVKVLRDAREYYLFLRGMTAWAGFRHYGLPYIPDKRQSGKSKYTIKRMWGFAVTGITSFSLKPLRMAVVLGMVIAALAFGYGIYAVIMKLFTDRAIDGWASVLASVLFIGGIQLTILGIIGVYTGKAFMESKHRPHYIVREKSQDYPQQRYPHTNGMKKPDKDIKVTPAPTEIKKPPASDSKGRDTAQKTYRGSGRRPTYVKPGDNQKPAYKPNQGPGPGRWHNRPNPDKKKSPAGGQTFEKV